MSHLAILGASGHGKVIADTASLDSKWESISFFDDSWGGKSGVMPWPIRGNTEDLLNMIHLFSGVVIGIGDNAIRQQKHELLTQYKAPITTIVHPLAFVSSMASIGIGSVVFAQAAINIHAHVGLSCIINTGSTVDHDCQLSNYVHISPGAHLSGNVRVGTRSWIGTGSAVRQGIIIGSDCLVGAGSTVVKSVPVRQTVVGTPAKNLLKTKLC